MQEKCISEIVKYCCASLLIEWILSRLLSLNQFAILSRDMLQTYKAFGDVIFLH